MKIKGIYFFLILLTHGAAISQNEMTECNDVLVASIMEDNFSPPVATRIHFYANAAAYEIYSKKNTQLNSLSKISHLPVVSNPIGEINYDIAAIVASINTGKHFIYTEDQMKTYLSAKDKIWKEKFSKSIVDNSIKYGEEVSKQIIAWSQLDNYGYTRTLKRFEINDSLGAWQPTPPEYKDGLEPNWNMMRKILYHKDSFVPFPHHDYYSEKKNSKCYKNMDTVYKKARTLTDEEKEIALYWDDNPMTTISKGHTMYVEKKPTPVGHWLKLTGQTLRQKKANNENAALVYTTVCASAYDATINCWRAKYVLNTIRPETYIQRLVNIDFKPFIESPPFPEYPSGHSTASASIGIVLDYYFPNIGSFTDSSQIMLGMKPRSFTSFSQAAREASISRFYGGIHILPALFEGEKIGRKVGKNAIRLFNSKL